MAHVLLIDDDADLIDVNKAELEAHGHQVSIAYTGDEGWTELGKKVPDIIILDAMMESFTAGFELAQDINLKFPDLPVIMLSGVNEYMSSDWEHNPKDDKGWLPVMKLLKKPVSPAALRAEIEKTLSEKK